MTTPDPNPRPRLFQFVTGDEVDVDRYTALSLREATAHFQLRQGYLRVDFGSVDERDAEIERMRLYRDERPLSDVDRFGQLYVEHLARTESQVVLVPVDWSGSIDELGSHAATARWSMQRDGDQYLVALRENPTENGAISPSLNSLRWRVPAQAIEMLLIAIGPQRVAEREPEQASDAARTGLISEVQRGPQSIPIVICDMKDADPERIMSAFAAGKSAPRFSAGDRVLTKNGHAGTIDVVHTEAPHCYVVKLDGPILGGDDTILFSFDAAHAGGLTAL